MTSKTNGQQLAATLRRIHHIGTRTRQTRKDPLGTKAKQNVIADAMASIDQAALHPGCYTKPTEDALKTGWAAVSGWYKHVEGYRLNGAQTAYLKSLTPWQFTALLGEMVDAGISNVGEAERWFAARQNADIAAWNAKTAA